MSGHTDQRYSVSEIASVLGFLVVGVVLGVGAYRAGGRLAGTGSVATVSAAPAGITPDGVALYAANCAGCHGPHAQGGVGPGLRAAAAWNSAQFAHAVLNGRAPERTLGTVMPRFATTGMDGQPPTDAQVAALHAFLKTLP
ncbi:MULTISPECIES: c-type cytochrome [Deinococcus]|uniref:C-type cytochrome n=1 Tax=Deinococcus rufus TaxID=2136097 RepID=A0ABV7Z7Q4_9DEIO|nr:c-type cytochrome [Deinococcus sp. AB2017081]WQE96233.1 c-type cytochrome [Deinococcus sp. AB2017081]